MRLITIGANKGGARRMNLESARVAATALCLAAVAVAVVSGFAAFMLSRVIDRHRDTAIVDLLGQVRDQLLVDRSQRAHVGSDASHGLALANPHQRLRAPVVRAQLAAPIVEPAVTIRVIAPDQRDRMVKILALAPADIVITSSGDTEADAFADQVAGVFRDAGWKVDRSLFVGMRALPALSANLPQTPRDVAVRAAFAAGGYALPPFDPAAPGSTREILIGALKLHPPLRARPASAS